MTTDCSKGTRDHDPIRGKLICFAFIAQKVNRHPFSNINKAVIVLIVRSDPLGIGTYMITVVSINMKIHGLEKHSVMGTAMGPEMTPEEPQGEHLDE